MNKYLLLAFSALMLSASEGMGQKLSPETELLLLKHRTIDRGTDTRAIKTIRDLRSTVDTESSVNAFVKFSDPSVITAILDAGCEVNTVTGDIATVTMPVGIIPDIVEIEGVSRIEVGRKVNLTNNLVRGKVKVNEVMFSEHPNHGSLPQEYRGNGVIVGMIDVGFEFTHAAFRTYDGNDRLRVSRVWNQNGYGKTPEGFSYGAEYTTFAEMSSAKTDADEYHGTHTTTTAAGSPAETPYYGMAPESELVLVSVNLGSDTNIIDAIKYIFDYADSQGKPAVVNMSLGSHNGPHDGNSLLDQAFGTLAGPGHILVGAAGNEAVTNLHCTKTLTEGDTIMRTMLAYGSSTTKTSYTYIWASPGSEISVEGAIVNPLRKGRVMKTTGEITMNSEADYHSLTEGTVTDISLLMSPVVVEGNSSPQMTIESYVYGLADDRKQAIIVHGKPGTTIHMWQCVNNNYFISSGLAGFTDGDNSCSVGEIGGTSDAVISVGSYDSDSLMVIPAGGSLLPEGGTLDVGSMIKGIGYDFETGRRSCFSSIGPTADGRMKPDVMAPGCITVSGFNKYCTAQSYKDYFPTVTDPDGNKYYFELSMGTSQATPAVTGSIALWLEANPDLSPSDVREIIAKTSDRDSYTGSEAGNQYGYGKLNAYAGILEAINRAAAIDEVAVDGSETKVWFDQSTDEIYCVTTGNATASIHTMTGTLVGTYAITPDNRTIDASSLTHGIYIVNVRNQGSSEGFKIAIP